MDLAELDFELPPERIAQEPLAERDAARLLVVDRKTGARHHARVSDLPDFVRADDRLVRNATRVVPARLRGRKHSGGAAEALLLGQAGPTSTWRALVRCRGRLREGLGFTFERDGAEAEACITALGDGGEVELSFAPGVRPHDLGETPLPPYIRRDAAAPADVERYQTVYARSEGSVAAPTAGLHFSQHLLHAVEARGAHWAEIVLHVGPGTFQPLREADLEGGRLHAEPFEVPEETAGAIRHARAADARVLAVGTTTTRALEHCGTPERLVAPGRGETRLLIAPGHRFRVVDALLTNFHLPRSSLLLLVCAFAGRDLVLDAYAEAVAEGYRFYSYGDAMLVL